MRMIRQQKTYDCIAAAWLMATNHVRPELEADFDLLYKELKHDGSHVIWPDYKPPHCYRAFNADELVNWAFSHRIAVTRLVPWTELRRDDHKIKVYFDPDKLAYILANNVGVMVGATFDRPNSGHAVAWDGRHVYDPNGIIYSKDKFRMDGFFVFTAK